MKFKAPKSALLLVVGLASVGVGLVGHIAGWWGKLAEKIGK